MEFEAPHIHAPTGSHTHTAILLHGRGSDGPEFAEELFSSMTSKNKNLPDCLPNWRWVFPTSRDRWTTAFQEEMCSWFDAYSLTDITHRQDLQVEGLRESVAHIQDILESEIRLLDGEASHVYLGGISQGMATALWTVLCAHGRIGQALGGILGFCGWLPFANGADDIIQSFEEANTEIDALDKSQLQRQISSFFRRTIQEAELQHADAQGKTISPIFTTPVLLGHGTDDVWVPVELGQQAVRILRKIMAHVEWREYSGAEREGHWIKEPEGFDYIIEFLECRSNVA
ncbi:hypothetical protein BDW72DRAFT_188409 [Aspergillus terricola var. indicus]